MGNCSNRNKINTDDTGNEAKKSLIRKNKSFMKMAFQRNKCLQNIPILQYLNKEQMIHMAQCLKEKRFFPGEDILTEGEKGKYFYLIISGMCEMYKSRIGKVSELTEYDYCGHYSLLNADRLMITTVKAMEYTTCLMMDYNTFHSFIRTANIKFRSKQNNLQILLSYQSAMSVDFSIDDEKTDSSMEEMDKTVIKWLAKCISRNRLFSKMKKRNVVKAIKLMKKKNASEYHNDCIITQGDTNGNEFFVVDEGKFLEEKDGKASNELFSGACIGETALLRNETAYSTIRAADKNATIWVLTRDDYLSCINVAKKKDHDRIIAFLRKMPLFGVFTNQEIELLSNSLQKVKFSARTVIVKQGDEGHAMYIIMKGQCIGSMMSVDGNETIFQLSESDYFGEISLRFHTERGATISAKTNVTLLQIFQKEFDELFEPLDSIMQRNIEEYHQPTARCLHKHFRLFKRSLEDFERGPMIGKGKFASVQLVYDAKSHRTYALKIIDKCWVNTESIKQSQKRIDALFNERNIMRELSKDVCPFLVKLHGTFKDEQNVYILMEACLGGDLYQILKCQGTVNENVARFYGACVIEAIDHIHSLNMLYRDVKPENVLLDARGYGKLCDFGFSKKMENGINKTFTLVGTPGYLAPEVILSQGYGKGVDWFGVGCLLYDLITGSPPYKTEATQFTMIREMMQNKLEFPDHASFWIKDLISKLLKLKPYQRIGVIKGGTDMIRQHHWFKGFDWNLLQRGEMIAPIQPVIESRDDVSNFDLSIFETSVNVKSKDTLPYGLQNWDVMF